MKIEQEIQIFKNYTETMTRVFAAKRADYGPSTEETFKKFGPVSFLVRMHDKLNRLDGLFMKPSDAIKVKDESIRDTLMDLANYCVIALVELDKAEQEKCKSVRDEIVKIEAELSDN